MDDVALAALAANNLLGLRGDRDILNSVKR